jgi:selenium metabolism protein YedF
MTILLDARGLACPAPVLLTKDAVEKETPDQLDILVDNDAAKENVTRFLGTKNYEVTAAAEGSNYRLTGRRRGDAAPVAAQQSKPAPGSEAGERQKIMVMLPTDRLGFGDDELGQKLVVSFIKTLKEMGGDLWRLVLVNNGVKLTIDGSPVLEDLQSYEKEGLTILVCGTCLSHFNLLEAKQVGQTTNMLDIVTAMQLADKVISI